MNTCTDCHKILSRGGKTSLCITCFNKARVGSKNPLWKGGVAKKRNPNSKFLGPLKERVGEKNPMFGRKHSLETRKLMFGKKHSPEAREKIRIAKTGEKNPMWKGDSVHYEALHEWMRKRIHKPEKCVICNVSPPRDLANISGEYKRDTSDWEYLCRSCHMKKDGRGRNGYIKVDRTLTCGERV